MLLRILFKFAWRFAVLTMPVALASAAWAGPGTASNCADPKADPASCSTCVSSAIYTNLFSGAQIIDAMFTTINDVLSSVEVSFYNGVVNGDGFHAVIGTAVVLYVAIYGLMIIFNISSYRISEISSRLIKVAFVYVMTSRDSWDAFQNFIGHPVLRTMNQVIEQFTAVAESGATGTNVGTPIDTSIAGLDPTPFSTMFGDSITAVFSVRLAAAIMAVATTGFFGWLMAIFLAWSLVEFFLMMMGAIITYAKAIIGLAFLFGIAPIFCIFLIFDRSRPIFTAWLSQVIAFALQPIMLFAFLSFYVALITEAIQNLLLNKDDILTDFCWMKWFSVPGALWDMGMWRPTHNGSVVSQEWRSTQTGDTLDEPIRATNVLYFLMVCHLGRTFSKFIETLSTDLAGGIGPGITRGADVAMAARQGLSRMRGKSVK